MGNCKGGGIVMGEIVHFPNNKKDKNNDIDVIQVSKNKIMVNGVEYESMDLEEFLMGVEISQEAEEKFIRGFFKIIKEACLEDFRILKIFREIFKGK